MSQILVVEDDVAIRQGLEVVLLRERHDVRAVTDAEAGARCIEELPPDLLLLDLMLPGMSGFELCRKLRREGHMFPILMLTARSEEADRVLGLDLGADDYVTKPFSVAELMARCRALLRRVDPPPGLPETLEFGEVFIDFPRYVATRSGQPVHMSPKGFGLLQLLAARSGKVVSRDTLLNEVWGYEAMPTTRTVDNQVAQLRAAIEVDPASPRHVITVHGVGYRFERGPVTLSGHSP
jgi:DNA-binding response OmpR family regulator